MTTFSNDLAITFVGLVAAFFVATLVIDPFTRPEKTRTWVLVSHFLNLLITSAILVIAVASGGDYSGGQSIALWTLSLSSCTASILILFIDLLQKRRARAKLAKQPMKTSVPQVPDANQMMTSLRQQPTWWVLAAWSFFGALVGSALVGCALGSRASRR